VRRLVIAIIAAGALFCPGAGSAGILFDDVPPAWVPQPFNSIFIFDSGPSGHGAAARRALPWNVDINIAELLDAAGPDPLSMTEGEEFVVAPDAILAE
jgi:hypothetical protein